jgi:superfamily II DNA or RNA helicase
MKKIINNKGYGVLLSTINDDELETLKESLTVKPNVLADYDFGQVESFPVYRLSEKYIYLPKFYGLEKYGSPDKIKEKEGQDINFTFNGQLKDHQIDFCNKLINEIKENGSCIASMQTGGGKTFCALWIAAQLKKKTLILVHKEFLLNQWAERIQQFLPGASIGVIQQNKCEIDKDIIIGMVQTIISRDYPHDTFSDISYSIFDECFAYKQLIVTDKGSMQIGTLYNMWHRNEVLPMVLSYNEKENIFEFKKITYAWEKHNENLLKINYGISFINCTENHRILTPNGYKEAHTLKIGDLIKCYGEQGTIKIRSIDRIKNTVLGGEGGNNKVYDLEIEDNHNFVLSSGIENNFGPIVHNCHHMSCKTFSQVLFKCKTKYSLGLSATPKRSDGLTKVLEWTLGKIIINIVLSDVEKPIIEFMQAEYSTNITPKFNFKGTMNAPDMINQLVADPTRNKQIIDKIIVLNKEGRKILILSGRREHCKNLKEMLYKVRPDITSGLYLGGMKCHSINTPIIMFDGSIKMVQNIQIGDLLMGDDSTFRKVLSIGRGEDVMYEIIPTKGDSYSFNSDHILCLKCTNPGIAYVKNTWIARSFDNKTIKIKNKSFETRIDAEKYLKQFDDESKICEISIKNYLNLSKQLKNCLKLYKVPVKFTHKEVPFDPYIIGLWIGDGTSRNTYITNQDAEVIIYLKKKLPIYNLYLDFKQEYQYNIADPTQQLHYNSIIYPQTVKKGINYFMRILTNLNLIKNKHIPDIYKINSRQIRLELLAGLLDSDGCLSNNCYHFDQKNERTMDDIIYLCRSLGFSAYKSKKKTSWTWKGEKKYGIVFSTTISGDIDQIPCKIKRKQAQPRKQQKNVLVTGFTIKEKTVDNYYGFELNKNSRYLLGNFTVTHNSTELDETNKTMAIFASFQSISEGFDLPALDTAIFSTGLGNPEQALGRILRRKNKLCPYLVDVTDPEFFGGQARRRKQFYKKKGYSIIGEKIRNNTDRANDIKTLEDSESETEEGCMFE